MTKQKLQKIVSSIIKEKFPNYSPVDGLDSSIAVKDLEELIEVAYLFGKSSRKSDINVVLYAVRNLIIDFLYILDIDNPDSVITVRGKIRAKGKSSLSIRDSEESCPMRSTALQETLINLLRSFDIDSTLCIESNSTKGALKFKLYFRDEIL